MYHRPPVTSTLQKNKEDGGWEHPRKNPVLGKMVKNLYPAGRTCEKKCTLVECLGCNGPETVVEYYLLFMNMRPFAGFFYGLELWMICKAPAFLALNVPFFLRGLPWAKWLGTSLIPLNNPSPMQVCINSKIHHMFMIFHAFSRGRCKTM